MNIKTTPAFLKGTIIPPASKSYLHRALISASLADGITEIKNFSLSEDVEDTISILRALGTEILIGETIIVKPNKWKNTSLRMRESGTTYRLMIPILSVFFDSFELEVSNLLRSRPLSEYEKLGLLKNKNTHQFKLEPGEFKIDGDISSQFVSGLLMALPLLEGDSVITFENPTSINYVLMTIEVLKDFGIEIEVECNKYIVKGNQSYKACDYEVEPDFSSIAFWAVAGVINGDIFVKAPRRSLQPDYRIIELLTEIGYVPYRDGFIFKKQSLKPFDISIKNCPDLAPSLALLASYIEGMSVIRDVDRLVYKESDRLSEIIKLNDIGGDIIYDQNLVIRKASFKESEVSQNDHRLGMMYTIIPLSMKIKNIKSIDKSYPNFLKDYQLLGGVIREYN